jgi:hypothetical protein
MQDAYFFGYGSLVNRLTHGYAPVHRAKARGWRRAWRATRDRRVAYLTVVPDPEGEIDGLIAPVPAEGWTVLDHREAAYERRPAAHQVAHAAGPCDIALYAIAEGRHFPPTTENPVLLSYLDVVLQGYLTEYGQDGAERFLTTTAGWQAPILDDRTRPRYPRAQRLTEAERAYVDDALGRLGCRPFAA